MGLDVVDRRQRFWHPVADVTLYEAKSVLWIKGRGFYEVQVCGLREILVQRIEFWDGARRFWGKKLRSSSWWPFGRR